MILTTLAALIAGRIWRAPASLAPADPQTGAKPPRGWREARHWRKV